MPPFAGDCLAMPTTRTGPPSDGRADRKMGCGNLAWPAAGRLMLNIGGGLACPRPPPRTMEGEEYSGSYSSYSDEKPG